MKAVFVSQIEDHVILSLDLSRQELLSGLSAEELLDSVLAVCREAGALPEEKPLPAVAPQTVCNAKNYKGLRIQRNGDTDEALKERLLDAVLEENEGSIPQPEIDSAVEYEFTGRRQNMKYQQLMSGEYDPFDTNGFEELHEQVEREVIRGLKVERLLQSIIDQEGLTTSREEREARGLEAAERLQVSPEMARNFFGEDMALLEGDILREKAVNLIFENAIII